MPKTAVALFEDPRIAEDVMREIEAIGFPRNEVRVLEEPEKFEVTGAMSFPRLDFETDLERALARIGASDAERQAYLEGLHHGGALVFATDAGEKADAAAKRAGPWRDIYLAWTRFLLTNQQQISTLVAQ